MKKHIGKFRILNILLLSLMMGKIHPKNIQNASQENGPTLVESNKSSKKILYHCFFQLIRTKMLKA